MNPNKQFFYIVLIVFLILVAVSSFDFLTSHQKEVIPKSQIHLAVCSNFSQVAKRLADLYEQKTGQKAILSFGSTGKFYAQIKNGAPYTIFFAADVDRPKLLEDQGFAQPGQRFTYAIGKLVLWSPDPDLVDARGAILEKRDFDHLAIANPELAPYGRAAQESLEALGLWDSLEDKIVRGENVSQALGFVQGGHAQLGFVAAAHLKQSESLGSFWNVPQSLYTPVEQQVVLLKDQQSARAFLSFVRSSQAREVIRSSGYEVPSV